MSDVHAICIVIICVLYSTCDVQTHQNSVCSAGYGRNIRSDFVSAEFHEHQCLEHGGKIIDYTALYPLCRAFYQRIKVELTIDVLFLYTMKKRLQLQQTRHP